MIRRRLNPVDVVLASTRFYSSLPGVDRHLEPFAGRRGARRCGRQPRATVRALPCAATTVPGPAPVLLFVPGAAWVQGTRVLQGHTLLSHLVKQGWVCLTMDYRASPVHGWPRHIADVNAAIAFA
jgi:acetyl esterase/lipase